jgi:hypothetical protein
LKERELQFADGVPNRPEPHKEPLILFALGFEK